MILRDERVGRASGLALSVVLLVWAALKFRTELIDDAYISLVYARNLARGVGLVWNPGEPVEGYTNFFWVLILSLLGPSPGMAWALGAVSGVLLLVLLAYPPAPLRVPGPAGMLLPVVLAANVSFAFWTAKGLETAAFSLLVTAGLFVHATSAADSERSVRRACLAILLLSLAALTRPEGFLFLAIALTDRAVRERRTLSISLVLLAVLLLGPHLVFRLHYYGYPLPNTYYAKVGSGPHQIPRGLDYVLAYLTHFPNLLVLVGLVAAALPARRGPETTGQDRVAPEAAERALALGTNRPPAVLWVALLGGLAAIVYVGGDGFGAFRFLVPLFPILYLVAVAGIERLSRNLPSPARAIGAGALVALLAAGQHAVSRRPVAIEEDTVVRFTSLMTHVGRLLRSETPASSTIALNPCGALPYYSERRTIDMLGLNDVHIAHVPVASIGRGRAGHEKGDGAYVLSRRPDLILISNVWVDREDSIGTIRGFHRSENEILANAKTFEEYQLTVFPLPDGRFLKALVRRSPGRSALRRDG